MKVHSDAARFNDPVRSAMTDKLETLAPSASDRRLCSRCSIAAASRSSWTERKFLGLITRTDLLSYLRLRMPK